MGMFEPVQAHYIRGNMSKTPKLHTTNSIKGRSTELHVMAELTFLGIPVFTTEHPHTRADLLVEIGDGIKKVQVKTMMWRSDRNYYFARPEDSRSEGYGDTVDFFVFFCREENEYFIVPYDEATKVYEVTWTPKHLRQSSGGANRKVDLDEYRQQWELLLPSDPSNFYVEQLNSIRNGGGD